MRLQNVSHLVLHFFLFLTCIYANALLQEKFQARIQENEKRRLAENDKLAKLADKHKQEQEEAGHIEEDAAQIQPPNLVSNSPVAVKLFEVGWMVE